MARIAIVGTGISGLGSAYMLHPEHDITVYEKADRVGGHSCTVTVDYDGVKIPVDTGFIVFNPRNYPHLTSLFARPGVTSHGSDMTFGLDPRRLAGMRCQQYQRHVRTAAQSAAAAVRTADA